MQIKTPIWGSRWRKQHQQTLPVRLLHLEQWHSLSRQCHAMQSHNEEGRKQNKHRVDGQFFFNFWKFRTQTLMTSVHSKVMCFHDFQRKHHHFLSMSSLTNFWGMPRFGRVEVADDLQMLSTGLKKPYFADFVDLFKVEVSGLPKKNSFNLGKAGRHVENCC